MAYPSSEPEAPAPPPSGIDLLRRGAYDEARIAFETALARNGADIEALYGLAVAFRKLHRYQAAAESLETLLALSPDHARAHQELGYCLLDLGRAPLAVSAFEKAVSLNPSLYGAWRALSRLDLYRGRVAAVREAEYWTHLPPPVLGAWSLLYGGRTAEAEAVCRNFLRAHPRDVEGMRALAALAEKHQALGEAELLLSAAIDFAPDHLRLRFDHANLLHKRQKFDDSLRESAVLLAAEPENPAFHVVAANALQSLGRFEDALAAFDEALRCGAPVAVIEVARGHCLKTMGRTAAAIEAYQRAYHARPAQGEAFGGLANLKTYRFTPAEIARMEEAVSDQSVAENDRIQFGFALGKAYEDRGEIAHAFAAYAQANALRARQKPYADERLAADLDFQRSHFDAAFFAARAGWGCPAPDPIFILGMPRAGSTLLEQILASHSAVEGTMELANVIALAQSIANPNLGAAAAYPEVLESLSAADFRALGENYLAETRRHRGDRPLFVDKMPNNFRHVALIHLMLPNARIIDARREPMACCFSVFKQFFADGQEFSYDLTDIGRYYRRYVEIMAHWDVALPGRVLRVQHEDLIADLETQVRRMLDYCGLPFEEACLTFYANRRAVRTPSSEQVRRPINDQGVDAWRPFSDYLDPLRKALSGL